MEEKPLHERYSDWPAESKKREELAREVFGRYMVSLYDGTLDSASRMLFEEWRYKSPTPEQQQFLDWIATLPEGDRQTAFSFVRQMVHLTVYSLLCVLDGLQAGRYLQDTVSEELRVVVELYPRLEDRDAVEPVEKLSIHPDSREDSLHLLWYDWLERYSRWSGSQDG